MKKLLDRLEKYLIRGVVLGVVALVVVQALLTQDTVRFYLSLGERMEGQKVEYPAGTLKEEEALQKNPVGKKGEEISSSWGRVTIRLQEYSSLAKAKVLVNGEEVASFRNDQVQVMVMAGDVIEIDSTYYSFPVQFKITAVSSNLSAPAPNQSFTSNQGIVMVGKVIAK